MGRASSVTPSPSPTSALKTSKTKSVLPSTIDSSKANCGMMTERLEATLTLTRGKTLTGSQDMSELSTRKTREALITPWHTKLFRSLIGMRCRRKFAPWILANATNSLETTQKRRSTGISTQSRIRKRATATAEFATCTFAVRRMPMPKGSPASPTYSSKMLKRCEKD